MNPTNLMEFKKEPEEEIVGDAEETSDEQELPQDPVE